MTYIAQEVFVPVLPRGACEIQNRHAPGAGSQAHMHDSLARMGRQVDLLAPRRVLEITLNVRLLHKAETQLYADDAAAVLVALEDGHVVAVVVDISFDHRANLRTCTLLRRHQAPLGSFAHDGTMARVFGAMGNGLK